MPMLKTSEIPFSLSLGKSLLIQEYVLSVKEVKSMKWKSQSLHYISRVTQNQLGNSIGQLRVKIRNLINFYLEYLRNTLISLGLKMMNKY